MGLHADHRTVFETEHGMIARKVAEFERADEAQRFTELEAKLAEAEALAQYRAESIDILFKTFHKVDDILSDMHDEEPHKLDECLACSAQQEIGKVTGTRLEAAAGKEGK